MKKLILKNLKIVAFGIVFAIGVSYANAWVERWNPRPASAPNSNIVTPITVGATKEVKTGDLSVEAFTANQDASFAKDITLEGFARGGGIAATGKTEVKFGNDTDFVNTTITNLLTAANDITVRNTANNGAKDEVGNDVLAHVCADKNGNVVLCEQPDGLDFCSNEDLYPGVQSSVPAGSWRNADGTCQKPTDVCKNIFGNQPSVPIDAETGLLYKQRADGTCYKEKTVAATVALGRMCDADKPEEWGIFGTSFNGCWLEIGGGCGAGSLHRRGTYTLKFNFPQPVAQATKLHLQLCVAHPGEYDSFLHVEAYPNAYTFCEGQLISSRTRSTNQDQPEVLSNTTPITINVPAGATSVETPDLYCARSGKGVELLWSYVKEIKSSMDQTTSADSAQVTNFTMPNGVTKICTSTNASDC